MSRRLKVFLALAVILALAALILALFPLGRGNTWSSNDTLSVLVGLLALGCFAVAAWENLKRIGR
jgi:hypothetical protein